MKPLARNLNIEETKKSYKKVVWFYDGWSKLTESKAAKKVIELAEITDGTDVVEIACGTGQVFNEIVKRNPNGSNVGIDLSPAMLHKAKKLLAKSNTNSYTLNEGDVLNLALENGSFDLVVNNFMLDLMPEETFGTIASEFYRILRPGGTAVISTFSYGTKRIHKIWGWVAKHFPGILTGCRPVDMAQYLTNTGFTMERELELSQNTFPSKVYKVRKTL